MPRFPEKLSEYLKADCNRLAFIQNYLKENGVPSVVLPLADKKHIYVKFPQSQYNPQFKVKTVVSHYDRAFGTPGANDNSAANFCLMEWAIRLAKKQTAHNVRLVFSDGEEQGKNGVASQGSFALASLFKKFIGNDDVYVFDCVGRGTVPILGKTNLSLNVPFAFRKKFEQLEERASRILSRSGMPRWLTLPFSYSDNAGFIANGIPAVAITMLPEDEVNKYYTALVAESLLEQFVMNHGLPEGVATREKLIKLQLSIPKTWRILHTTEDTEETLTPESFTIVSNILDVLASEKTPV